VKKLERSGSVPRNLSDGANPHIGRIFSREPLRSRRSPSKQPRAAPAALQPNTRLKSEEEPKGFELAMPCAYMTVMIYGVKRSIKSVRWHFISACQPFGY
jgi:hypothetical protein